MITADEIVCRIPTEYAIKLEEFYCSVAYPVSSADSQTWAAWVTAIATVGLAVLALAAWSVAKKSLNKMQAQIDVSERRVIEERQQAYFIEYWLSVNKFADIAFDKDSDLRKAQREMFLKWQIWTLDMYRDNREFRKLTSEWHGYWVDESSRIRGEEKRLNSPVHGGSIRLAHEVDDKAKRNLEASIANFRLYLPRYMSALQRWQAEITNRKHIQNRLDGLLKVVKAKNDE